MKKSCAVIGVAMLVIMISMSAIFVSPAFSADDGNLLFSAESNSIWVLNKAKKKLIYMRFIKPDEVWKSNPVPIPAEFNVEKCKITAVGRIGDFVFLIDQSQGLVTFFQAQKDHTVDGYIVVPVNEAFK
ncbi:MAG: hypothetical protein KJN62_05475 [Deltaproteobacteria bacterium]|nr:hypothetical protein [Deltaproteobacteria bacterium]